MKNTTFPIIMAWLMFASFSCKNDQPQPAHGKIAVKVSVMYDTITVTNARVFLEPKVTAFPGTDTTLYDWKESVNTQGSVTFYSLFTGNYYLYSEGMSGVDTLAGSQAIVLAKSDEHTTIQTTLAVSKQ